MLFLVAFAKMPSFGGVVDNKFVDYKSIRPLVIDKVVVKAKKMKEEINEKEINMNMKGKQRE
jgi:hypothetical protein